jgi:glycine dehydrogenase subunit 1
MLEALGLPSLESLFTDIPKPLRFPDIGLEPGVTELEVMAELEALAASDTNADLRPWFLGAGLYDHFIPAAVGSLSGRSEFVTAYTPYQSEVSQGTLQSIFEYQSMIAELFGMEVVNAGHYDGASALAEGVLLALKQAGDARRRVLVPEGLHPEYRAVLETYLSASGAVIETYGDTPDDRIIPPDLACFVAAYPDFFGFIPDLSGIAGAVHKAGALFLVHADPVMLGLFKSPGAYGADIVSAEGQSLGNDLNFGGPGLGIMAVTQELMRRIPGRIAGAAKDREGRRGFVLTLSAREQHIRREKAVSNICSNQGLAMLRACIYLALMGKAGLRRVAELCWHKSHYAASRIADIGGFAVRPGLFFKEFVVKLPADYDERRFPYLVPGFPLSRYFPERKRELLICITEKHSRTDIDALIEALKKAYTL